MTAISSVAAEELLRDLVAIASPSREEAEAAAFLVDWMRAAGYDVAAMLAFADHHRFSARDVAGVARRARELAADAVLTTEKDMVRLRPLAPFGVRVAPVPLRVGIEPAERFEGWLLDRLRASRRLRAEER